MNKDRDIIFDIFKGIAIILMVAGHAYSPGKSYFCLFHMAVFFIVSGIFFKEKHYENFSSLIKAIKSKCCHLYLPFIFWSVPLILIHNFLMNINIYTNNPKFLEIPMGASYGLNDYYSLSQIIIKTFYALLFFQSEQLAGATWFLRVLFWISVMSLMGHYILSKFVRNKNIFNIIVFFIYTAAFLLGYFLQKNGVKFYGIGIMLSCSVLYYAGILYRSYKNKININFPLFIVSVISLVITHHYISGQISLSKNAYPSPTWLLIASFTGFILLLYISKVLSKSNFISKVMSYIGQHTISILLFHLLAFKLVTYIHITIYSEPSYYLAAYPVLVNNGCWWLVYCLFGVLLSLTVAFCWERFRHKIEKSN